MNFYITATQARHFQVFHDGKLLAEGHLWATQGIVGQFKLKQAIPIFEIESQITHCLSVKRVVDILHKGGSCLINGARQANSGESLVIEFPQETDEQKPDLRPGNYYVSARDAGNYWLLAGPWNTHAEALAQVKAVWDHCRRADPIRAEWKAYGTCRRSLEDIAQASILGSDPKDWAYVEIVAQPRKKGRR
jgi:hypothetical protein